MTSERQFAANRRNALHSSGPKTEGGKRRSRRNAVRHGLTAETVIGVLEDPEDYQAFEAAILSDYVPQSVIERELVLRLASLLWRLRRANSIETGLFQIHGEILRDRKNLFEIATPPSEAMQNLVYRLFKAGDLCATQVQSSNDRECAPLIRDGTTTNFSAAHSRRNIASRQKDIARCFLRLANLENGILERIGRYEAALWRQVVQILMALEAIRRQLPFRR
jgi:hypothetical protein